MSSASGEGEDPASVPAEGGGTRQASGGPSRGQWSLKSPDSATCSCSNKGPQTRGRVGGLRAQRLLSLTSRSRSSGSRCRQGRAPLEAGVAAGSLSGPLSWLLIRVERLTSSPGQEFCTVNQATVGKGDTSPVDPPANVVPAWTNGLRWSVDHL